MAVVGVDGGAGSFGAGLFEDEDLTRPSLLKLMSFPTSRTFEADMTALGETLAELDKISPITAVGLTVPALLSSNRQKVVFGGNLPGWEGCPVATRLAQALPVRPGPAIRMAIGNDAEAQALYEALTNPALYGVDFVYWAVGSGIGTARITWVNGPDGRRVPISLPCEGQHIVQLYLERQNPEVCGCGQYDCTERLASGDGSAQRFSKHMSKLTEQEWELVAEDQARGLLMLLACHPVETVVIGGGVVEEGKDPHLVGRVQRHLAIQLAKGEPPAFVRAKCTKLSAAVAGVALLNRG